MVENLSETQDCCVANEGFGQDRIDPRKIRFKAYHPDHTATL